MTFQEALSHLHAGERIRCRSWPAGNFVFIVIINGARCVSNELGIVHPQIDPLEMANGDWAALGAKECVQ